MVRDVGYTDRKKYKRKEGVEVEVEKIDSEQLLTCEQCERRSKGWKERGDQREEKEIL